MGCHHQGLKIQHVLDIDGVDNIPLMITLALDKHPPWMITVWGDIF